MPLALLPNLGLMELLILGVTALLLIVSAIRFFRQRTDQGRTIAILVEENQRLREALGEKSGARELS